MTDREQFEAKFPVPEGTRYSEERNKYVFKLDGGGLVISTVHQAKWEAWQAAKEIYLAQGRAEGLQAAADSAKKWGDARVDEFGGIALRNFAEHVKQLQPTDLVVLTKGEVERLRRNVSDLIRHELRQKIIALDRSSFLSPKEGGVIRVKDRAGKWLDYYDVIPLFEFESFDEILNKPSTKQ